MGNYKYMAYIHWYMERTTPVDAAVQHTTTLSVTEAVRNSRPLPDFDEYLLAEDAAEEVMA